MSDLVRLHSWCVDHAEEITAEHIALSQIPAPTGQEEARSTVVLHRFVQSGLKEVQRDDVGNVLGLLPGRDSSQLIVLAAHLDTVFSAGTDVRVQRLANGRLVGPGISDNAAALATITAVARGFQELGIKPQTDVLFFAPVGEEGRGNLRGTIHLFDHHPRRSAICAFVTLDADTPGSVSAVAVGSRRFAVTFDGPGGHSHSDFGQPSALHAACRAVSLLVGERAADVHNGTLNVGVLGSSVGNLPAGTSVNTICAEARFEVDLRSTDAQVLEDLDARLSLAVTQALETEIAWATLEPAAIDVAIDPLGYRPCGSMPTEHPLYQAAAVACQRLGLQVTQTPASTDANIPLSKGIPALILWRGGTSGGTHTLQEWHDPAGRHMLIEVLAEILTQDPCI